MTLSPVLRARIQTPRLTSVVTRYNVGTDVALAICPRLAWSARIAEFEWIEVRNLTRQTRHEAYVVFGEESKVEWWPSGETAVQAGDALQLSIYAWLNPDTKGEHIAHLVRTGRHNAPIKIRRITARAVPADPHFFLVPPRKQQLLQVSPTLAENLE